MTITNTAEIEKFCKKHSDAQIALSRWHTLMKEADCLSWNELKLFFNTVDNVGNDHYVFNIKGNKHRLIAVIFFQLKTVNICRICTHEDYDNIKPKPEAISKL